MRSGTADNLVCITQIQRNWLIRGDSGTGREGIGYSIEEMTILKTVVFNLAPAKMGKKKKIVSM
jgi:hypothetical protein